MKREELQSDNPGYIFLPLPQLPDLGYGELEIYIGSKPLDRFFDTCRATFLVIEDGLLRNLVVDHPWLSNGIGGSCRVCAGRFHLYETDGDERLGFSLGGELEIRQDNDWVICRLTSTAPIFNLSEEPDSTNRWLVDEIEGLFARRRAFYGEDDDLFVEKLQTANPLTLFISALSAMEKVIQSLPVAVRSSYQDQYNVIRHKIHIMQVSDVWPYTPPNLEDLL